jgi:hypothetical protein
LSTRKTRNAHTLAQRAVEAATSQHITLPGETLGAQIVQTLAQQVLELHAQIGEIDKLIAARFHQHPSSAVIESLPGFGPLLGAEFLAITGGDMSCFDGPDQLAAMAGLAPVPRDSGRISGNFHRPKRYHRGLQRVFYYSAINSIRWSDESQRFYTRKRAEGTANDTPTPFWPSPAGGSTCCGPCCATNAPTTPTHPSWQPRPDKIIGKPLHVRDRHAARSRTTTGVLVASGSRIATNANNPEIAASRRLTVAAAY